MDNFSKYTITRVLQVITLLGALLGLYKIATGETTAGAVIMFGSVAVGLGISIAGRYYRARMDYTTDRAQKIALNTLAKLGRQRKNR